MLGTLAYLVRTSSVSRRSRQQRRAVGRRSRRPVSRRRGLTLITQLGETWFAVVLVIVVSVVGYLRRPNRWIPVFLLTVLVGQWLLTNGIKELLDRVRPTLNPSRRRSGPRSRAVTRRPPRRCGRRPRSFSAEARRHGRALLAGGAVGIAVAVACTRVFLDVHWLTDTIAGLFLGWAWFAACVIAFGGRFLQFGRRGGGGARGGPRAPPRRQRTVRLAGPSAPGGVRRRGSA